MCPSWRTIVKKLKLSTLLAALPFSAAKGEEEYIQYDFSNPAEVYKATLAESVTKLGISARDLYAIMRAGQVVIVNDHPASKEIPWLTTAGCIVNAPPEHTFKVVTDIGKYPEFMPQTNKAVVTPVADHIERIDYELGINVLLVTIDVPYSVYHYHQPPTRTDWVMAGGDFEANCGAYEVVPLPGDPGRSLLFYTSYSLPRNALVNSLFDKIPMLDMMINLSTGTLVVRAMKTRVETLWKNQGGKVAAPAGGPTPFLDLLASQADNLARLSSRGKLVVIEDSSPPFYSGGMVVDAPMAEVYQAATHLDDMSKISRYYAAEYLERSASGARVAYTSIIPLMIDFESHYTEKVTFTPPNRVAWVGEPGGDLEGIAGSWEMVPLSDDRTLVFYRNTSNLGSQGFMMRKILAVEPTFELAIQACQTQYIIADMKRWCEASPEQRSKLAESVK